MTLCSCAHSEDHKRPHWSHRLVLVVRNVPERNTLSPLPNQFGCVWHEHRDRDRCESNCILIFCLTLQHQPISSTSKFHHIVLCPSLIAFDIETCPGRASKISRADLDQLVSRCFKCKTVQKLRVNLPTASLKIHRILCHLLLNFHFGTRNNR